MYKQQETASVVATLGVRIDMRAEEDKEADLWNGPCHSHVECLGL